MPRFFTLKKVILLIVTVICFAILGVQVLYVSLFLIAFSKEKKTTAGSPRPVSVVVCAHDEEQNLRELVPLLLAQNHPEFELIIVEDRCNDGTYDYLLEATKHDTRLKMVRVVNKPEHINGKKFALTLGIKAARFDWVLLTDADCRPTSELWMTKMSEQMTDKSHVVLGFSPYLKGKGLLNSFIRFESFLTGIQFMSLAVLGRPYMGVGRNLAYRKSLFLESKGFNTHLGIAGGDDDLFVNQHAKGSSTVTCMGRETLMMSEPKTTWGDYYVQKLRHLSVGRFYKFSDKVILGLFTLSWLLTWLFVVPAAPFTLLGEYVFITFVLRWILLLVLMKQASKKLGEPFEVWKTPFLDFIYAFYYLVTGPKALVSKKIRWKS